MRLLHSKTLVLEEFSSSATKPYAILSHTWGEGEVSFQEMQRGEGSEKPGYSKIRGCCEVAYADGFRHVWIDTCCIDKTSSSELSEAINSIYKWYQEAEVCYVYLADVSLPISSTSFAASRWFTRGWTLQELIAPACVIFFDANWKEIGTKASLLEPIAQTTGIHANALRKANLAGFSVAQRMSWASSRETTRVEDEAYCLMGIFSINMPMLYEEEQGAFLRLQEEIMKKSDDHSIFAWERRHAIGFLARSLTAFADSSTIIRSRHRDTPPFTVTNKGIHLQLPLKAVGSPNNFMDQIYVAVLDCQHEQKPDELLGIWVIGGFDGRYRRHHYLSFFRGYNAVPKEVSDAFLPTINHQERESLPKVSLYIKDEKNPLSFGQLYTHFKIDKTGIDEKHAYLSNIYPQSRILGEKAVPLGEFFTDVVGILGFKSKDNSGDRFLVALLERNDTLAACVNILHQSETLIDALASLKSNSRNSLLSPYISDEIPSTALGAGGTRSALGAEGMSIFADRIKWQYPGKPWSVYVTIKRQLVGGNRAYVVYIETKENMPGF
jgi:hypothetical protein